MQKLHSWCKACIKIDSKRYAKENKVKVSAYISQWSTKRGLDRKLKFIEEMGNCCFDCKQSYPREVYDFHHLDNKVDAISNLLLNASDERLNLEIKKCVLLCANCHRIRHWTEKQNLKQEQVVQ